MDQHQSPSLELRAGPSRLILSPAFGGTILRYATQTGDGWIDWLRPTEGTPELPGDTASFPLVPFSNRVRDSLFMFRGREVRLPREPRYGAHFRHGFGCLGAWRAAEQTVDRAVLEFRDDAESWPFPFRARQDFHLTADALTITMEIVNTGTGPMPAGMGLHPYFPRTPRCRVEAPVAAMWAADAEVMPLELLTPPPPGQDPSLGIEPATTALDSVYTGWSQTARIAWPERRARLTMTAERPFDFLIVFTPPGRDFFCVEPVTHMTDAFNLAAKGREDTGMIVLESGQSAAAAVRFAVEIASTDMAA